MGEDYNKFIHSMKSLGYDFDSRELVAADYGAPTTRKRWYGVFRSDGEPITWPEPTHNKDGSDGLKKWEPISKCIDWTDLGSSIFTRKIPLKEKTLNRIARGIDKFIANDPNPYLLPNDISSSFLIQYHGETKAESVRGQSLNEPIKTIDTSNRYGLVTTFITKFYKTGTGQSVEEPIHTITTSPGHFGLVSAFLIKYYGQGIGQPVDRPIDTIPTKDRFGLVTVMIKGEPYQIVDIWFRMLKPEELKLGQGFPKEYIIDHDYTGKAYPKSKQVERIGNSVVPVMAELLTRANMPESCRKEQAS
jgi:DNA (cytosine-5)-methyltransferase 1